MNNTIDLAITYRILKQLISPWKSQDAFKLGIIDEHGKELKKVKDLKSDKEKNAYSILTRLIFKLKQLLDKVPSGIKTLGSIAAAMAILKECYATDTYPEDVKPLFEASLQYVDSADTLLIETMLRDDSYIEILLNEDGEAPTTTTANVVGTGDDTSTPTKKLFDKPLRRKPVLSVQNGKIQSN